MNTKHSHKLREDVHFVLQMLDLSGELLFFGGHVLQDNDELVDALAVDEDAACEVKRLDVVANGVEAGDGKGLDITERLAVQQRNEGVAPGILGQALFGGGNHHIEVCQVLKLRLEDVERPCDLRAELKLVEAEALVHGVFALEKCKMQADTAQVVQDFRVGRGRVDGVAAFGVAACGVAACGVAVHGRHVLVWRRTWKPRGFEGFFFNFFLVFVLNFTTQNGAQTRGKIPSNLVLERKEEICHRHHAEGGEEGQRVWSCSEEGARGQESGEGGRREEGDEGCGACSARGACFDFALPPFCVCDPTVLACCRDAQEGRMAPGCCDFGGAH